MVRKAEKIKHQDFIKQYAKKMKCSEANAERYLNGFVETLFDNFRENRSVTITHFGNFCVSKRRDSTAFKFNPSQKLKALLGWASGYRGDL